MKRILHTHIVSSILISGYLLVSSSNSAIGSEQPHTAPQLWSLQSAVAFTVENNPNSKIALQRITQAEQSLRLAQAANHPDLSLGAEYSQTNNPMYSFGNILNQGAFTNSIDFNSPGRTDNAQLQLQLHYSLYNGGKDQSTIRAEEARLEGSSDQMTAIRQQLAYEVVKSFQAIIQAKEMTKVRAAALQSINTSYTVAKARFEAGDMLEQDLLNLELQQTRCNEEHITSLHQLEVAESIFFNLLGKDQETDAIDFSSTQQLQPPDELNTAKRIELKIVDAQIRSAEAGVDAAKSAKKPTINSFAQYQIDAGSVLEESGDSWMTGVKFNYPIYDGNRADAALAQATSKLREAQLEKEKLSLALSLELQKAKSAYIQAKEQLQVTEKMVAVAAESTRLTRIRFQEGVVLASNLIDMEMRLTDAHARNIAAQSEYQIAIATLRRATGVDQFAVNEQK